MTELNFIEETKKFFNENKYINLYFKIILKALKENREYNSLEREKHHILPRSIFPEYQWRKKNLIVLTFREHFICYTLLWKYYKNNKKHKRIKCV
jgi:hypothetical protein